MQESIRVFISSRMNGEVAQLRQQLVNAINDFAQETRLNLEPIVFEHQCCPPSITARDASISLVESCDLFVGLYYKSITPVLEDEFEAADSLGMPILTFVKGCNENEVGPGEIDGYHALRHFLSTRCEGNPSHRSQGGYVYKVFTGEDLKPELKRSLFEYYPSEFQFRRLPAEWLPTQAETDELRVLKRLYVPPSGFDDAEALLANMRLLVISGPPHTGKTSMASILADKWLNERRVRRIAKVRHRVIPQKMAEFEDTLFLFDDPFGGTQFDPISGSFGDSFEVLLSATDRNFVVITTRKSVFSDAKKRTKLGEMTHLQCCEWDLTPERYSKPDLYQILQGHLHEYVHSPCLRLEFEKRTDRIIQEYQFPHNYRMLVIACVGLGTSGGLRLEELIDRRTPVEESVGNWFSEQYLQNKELFYLLFSLALFPYQLVDSFVALHAKMIRHLKENKDVPVPFFCQHDLKRIACGAISYITTDTWVEFRHPSYREGISSKLWVDFRGEFYAVLDLLGDIAAVCPEVIASNLYSVASQMVKFDITGTLMLLKKWVVGNCVRRDDITQVAAEIAVMVPESALELVGELLRSDNYSVRSDARRILGHVINMHPDLGREFVKRTIAEGSGILAFECVHALDELASKDLGIIWPMLKDLAKHEEATVRQAVALLMRHAPFSDAGEPIVLLRTLAEDEDWLVGRAASASLERICSLRRNRPEIH